MASTVGTLADWMPRLVAAWRNRDDASPLDEREKQQILDGIATLSAGLTRTRELVGDRYLDEPRLLGAYLLFYWPVSYAQARSVLGELGRKPGRVLDVGAGPAPLAFAAHDAGATRLVALDRSRPALAVAARLAAAHGIALETIPWVPKDPLPEGPFDTIVVGHLLNELPAAEAEALCNALLDRLAPNGDLVLIEPALRETSRRLLGLRDRLVAGGIVVKAPCLFRGGCPALVRESDWCHAERPLVAPQLVAELARAAALHRDSVKMTYLILAAPGSSWPGPATGPVFRMVSEQLPEKGKTRLFGCGPDGRLPLVLPDKRVSDDTRAFLSLRRGDLFSTNDLVQKGDGQQLSAASRVEILALAGQPPRGRSSSS